MGLIILRSRNNKETNEIAPRQICAHPPSAVPASPGSMSQSSVSYEEIMTSTITGTLSEDEEESAPLAPPQRPVRGRGRPPSARLKPAGHIPRPALAVGLGGVVHRMSWTQELNECLPLRSYKPTSPGNLYYY
ncbi:hypothetical protein K1T71_002395 [Dendrolimus kikuchii]|uniref:Uncharacterized protein n=1 Tax=Dendrolimus kikuchii TaxID=765133 RepID=A0ACC1DCJ8_9NEOP|nr:hypothetical protein K1T71_002395 [Dendrolimus kikuchii]